MGAKPLFALNIVGFPINELPKEVLSSILKGGSDKAEEAGIPIVGGHSIDDKEPKYGLVVSGEVQKSKLIKNSEAKEGDTLVLTKPLGSGIISTAMVSLLPSNWEHQQSIDAPTVKHHKPFCKQKLSIAFHNAV